MLRLLLLTSGLTLAITDTSVDCLDKKVDYNNSIEIKKFTSREGKLLFFPGQGFDGVSVNLIIHDSKTVRINPEDLCVNDSRWYKLEVTVSRGWSSYQECSFKVDTCSGKCGSVRDWSSDDFKSFSVVAHGTSYWSVDNVENRAQCRNPDFSSYNSTAAPKTRRSHENNPNGSGEALMPWLVAICVSAFIVGVVVVMVCIVRKANLLRLGQERENNGFSSSPSPPGAEESVNMTTNSLYEPFCGVTFTDLQQQREDDGLPSDPPPPRTGGGVTMITNSLYEPFCGVTYTGSGEPQQHDDMPSSGSPADAEEALYVNTTGLSRQF